MNNKLTETPWRTSGNGRFVVYGYMVLSACVSCVCMCVRVCGRARSASCFLSPYISVLGDRLSTSKVGGDAAGLESLVDRATVGHLWGADRQQGVSNRIK